LIAPVGDKRRSRDKINTRRNLATRDGYLFSFTKKTFLDLNANFENVSLFGGANFMSR